MLAPDQSSSVLYQIYSNYRSLEETIYLDIPEVLILSNPVTSKSILFGISWCIYITTDVQDVCMYGSKGTS